MIKTSICSATAMLAVNLLLTACGGGGGGGASKPPPVVHSGGNLLALGVGVDANRNVYLGGYTDGGLDGNTLIGQHDLFVVKYNAAGNKVWTREFGAPGANAYVYALAVDAQGNAYVAGNTDAGLDGNSLIGVRDAFLTKYDTAGNRIRTIEIGAVGQQVNIYSMAVDSNGNVYAAGQTSGGLDGNGETGSTDLFYMEFDSAGNKLRTRQLGVTGVKTLATGIAVDGNGNVFMTGETLGGLDGNSLVGAVDMFATAYDANGNRLWTRQYGAPGSRTFGNKVALDKSGNILVVGTTDGALDGNSLTGTQDMFLMSYDATGTRLRTKQLGVAGKDTSGDGICVDLTGTIYVVGSTSGGLDGNAVTGRLDAFITRYDSTGNKLHTTQFGAPSSVVGITGGAIDTMNNLHIAGLTSGALDGNAFVGIEDIFYMMFDSSGNKVRTKELGIPVI
jgi:hypothetical protein